MKCEECGGTGKVQKWFYERTGFGKCEKVCGDVKCEWCNGTGEVEQTEQEWLQTANTEQLAEFLIASIKKCKSCASGIGVDEVQHCPFGECGCHFKSEVIEWLKLPHREG